MNIYFIALAFSVLGFAAMLMSMLEKKPRPKAVPIRVKNRK
ncbi:MAG: hypothetical protein OEY93_11400 [Anaerolineae bacterium]|nr:hypothetical protein [Anaerolineae bacterium]